MAVPMNPAMKRLALSGPSGKSRWVGPLSALFCPIRSASIPPRFPILEPSGGRHRHANAPLRHETVPSIAVVAGGVEAKRGKRHTERQKMEFAE